MQERRRKKLFGIRIPGDPVAKQRPQATVTGKRITVGGQQAVLNARASFYTPAKTKQAEKQLQAEFRARRIVPADPYTFEVAVHLDFYTKTAHRKDIDNLMKVPLDAMNGLIIADDSQVFELSSRLWRKDAHPKTELTVWALLD